MDIKSLKAVFLYGTIIAIAVGFTIVSLRFVRPAVCQSYCEAPKSIPCPPGACRDGDQRAGLPLPVLIDNAGGSSPTTGWGILGPEDLPNPVTFVVDVFFYSVLLRMVWYLLSIFRHNEQGMTLRVILLPSIVLLVGVLVGFAVYWPVLTK
jgi:hypothetical protein